MNERTVLLTAFLLLTTLSVADDWSTKFREAEAAFNGRSQSACIPLFKELIQQMDAAMTTRALSSQEVETLSRSLDYLGQTYFNLNQQEEVRATLLKLIESNPAYTLNEDLVSSKFIDVYNKLKADHLAGLAITVAPAGASVTLDGRPVESARLAAIPLLKGEHTVEVSKSGYLSQKSTVTVNAGETGTVNVTLVVDPARRQAYVSAMQQLHNYDASSAKDALQNILTTDEGNVLAQVAMAEAWLLLGSDKKAREAAQLIVSIPQEAGLSADDAMLMQGVVREASGASAAASEIYSTYLSAHPDSVDAAVRLARAWTHSGKAKDAIEAMRRQRFKGKSDPRLDLLEAEASEAIADFKDQRDLAATAATSAKAQNMPVIAARARLLEGRALLHLRNEAEARRAFQEILDLPLTKGDDYERAQAHLGLGEILMARKDIGGAEKEIQLAQNLLNKIGNESLMPSVNFHLGNVALAQKEFTPAKSLYQVALPGIPGPYRAALLLHLGEAMDALKDTNGARPRFEEALRLSRESGNKEVIAGALLRLADAAAGEKTVSMYEEAARLFEEVGDLVHRGDALFLLAQVLEQRGEPAAAQARYEEAVKAYQDAGEKDTAAQALKRLGDLLTAQNLKTQAAEKYEQASTISRETGTAPAKENLTAVYVDERNRVVVLLQQGFEALNKKDFQGAARAYDEALGMAKQIGDRTSQANALNSLGFVYSRQGNDAAARDKWQQALEVSREAGDKAGQAMALFNLSTAEFNLGNLAQANSLYEQSATLYRELGQTPRPKPW